MLLTLLLGIVWATITESIFPGIWIRTLTLTFDSPLLFSGLMLAPLIAFFSQAMIWKTILLIYGYRLPPLTLLKYVINDFGLSFTIPSGGIAGRSARTALAISSGVKPAAALSSVILDATVFAIQTFFIMAGWIIIGRLGLVNFDYQVMSWLEFGFAGVIIFLISVFVGAKFIPRFKSAIGFLRELNDCFAKILSLPLLSILQIILWLGLWYFGVLVEIWFITEIIGLKLELQTFLLFHFFYSVFLTILPSPLGLGTADITVATVFAGTNLNLAFVPIFLLLWRVRNIAYMIIGWSLIGDRLYKEIGRIKEIFKKEKEKRARNNH